MPIQYPNNADYELAIKNGADIFNTLSKLIVHPSKTRPIKYFTYGSGSYAVVFKGNLDGDDIAIRLFLQAAPDIALRYQKISQYLNNKNLFWYNKVSWLDNEIRINNSAYPLILMKWAKGIPINDYIAENLENNNALSLLQNKIVEIIKDLEKNKVGHGDFQHGNIFIVRKGQDITLSLVDYDNMYVPTLSDHKSKELGLPQYQHPKRTKYDYNHKIDRFSVWVYLTALEAIKTDKKIWKNKSDGGYNNGENVLFEGVDLLKPDQSKLFQLLLNSADHNTRSYAKKLKGYCLINSLDGIEKPIIIESNTSRPNIVTEIESSEPNKTQEIKEEHILIKTNPLGAVVLNNRLEKIGNTPLLINKTISANHILHIRLKEHKRTIKIDNINGESVRIDFPSSDSNQSTSNKRLYADNRINRLKGIVGLPWGTERTTPDNAIKKWEKAVENKGEKEKKIPKTLVKISLKPSSAVVIINKKIGGTGNFKREFENGKNIDISVLKEGYYTINEKIKCAGKPINKDYHLNEIPKRDGWMVLSIVLGIILLMLFVSLNDQEQKDWKKLYNVLSSKHSNLETRYNDRVASLENKFNDIIKDHPISIHSIEFSNESESDVLSSYGSSLYSSSLRYLKPRIHVTNKGLEKSINFQIKIFNPTGTLRTGSTSPLNYTYEQKKYVYSTQDKIELYGWGNKDGGNYPSGVYKIEIWIDDRIQFSDEFKIY